MLLQLREVRLDHGELPGERVGVRAAALQHDDELFRLGERLGQPGQPAAQRAQAALDVGERSRDLVGETRDHLSQRRQLLRLHQLLLGFLQARERRGHLAVALRSTPLEPGVREVEPPVARDQAGGEIGDQHERGARQMDDIGAIAFPPGEHGVPLERVGAEQAVHPGAGADQGELAGERVLDRPGAEQLLHVRIEPPETFPDRGGKLDRRVAQVLSERLDALALRVAGRIVVALRFRQQLRHRALGGDQPVAVPKLLPRAAHQPGDLGVGGEHAGQRLLRGGVGLAELLDQVGLLQEGAGQLAHAARQDGTAGFVRRRRQRLAQAIDLRAVVHRVGCGKLVADAQQFDVPARVDFLQLAQPAEHLALARGVGSLRARVEDDERRGERDDGGCAERDGEAARARHARREPRGRCPGAGQCGELICHHSPR